MSSASRVNSPLVHHSSNTQQPIFTILPPALPIRPNRWQHMSIQRSMRSTLLCSERRPQLRSSSNASTAISTTYTTEDENGTQHINDDSPALRKGFVSLSCTPSCHNRNVLKYRSNIQKRFRHSTSGHHHLRVHRNTRYISQSHHDLRAAGNPTTT